MVASDPVYNVAISVRPSRHLMEQYIASTPVRRRRAECSCTEIFTGHYFGRSYLRRALEESVNVQLHTRMLSSQPAHAVIKKLWTFFGPCR